jgi:YD repeat-containing protein
VALSRLTDGAGRLIAVTNALGTAQSLFALYQYDEAGNEIAQIVALNRMNTFQYDGLGRRIQHSLPGGQSETFGYDPVGNLICYTNFNGAVITNVYDLMNRLTARI